MSILGIAIQNMLAHEDRLIGDTTPVKPHIRAWQKQISDRIAFSRFMLSLELQLTHSLVPDFAIAGTSPTFTRATTATVTDNEGILRTAIAGEARFVGARRVHNRVATTSEDFSNATWAKANTTVVANQATAPNGTTTADLLYPTTTGTVRYVWQNPSVSGLAAGASLMESVYVKAAGKSWVCLGLPGTGANEGVYFNISTGVVGTVKAGALNPEIEDVGDGWYRCSLVHIDAAGGVAYSIINVVDADNSLTATTNGTDGVYLWGAQIEDITGRTDQTTPSEYVSVGVLSAPYHGAGVDGVKYFNTSMTGAAIPAATNLGYLAEAAATNLCLQSNSLTTWTNSPALSTLTQNVIGPDGATSAWTCTDTDAANTSRLYQVITLTAAAYTASLFVKKTSGATAFPVILLTTGTVYGIATLDTNNGVATAWTSNSYGPTLGGVSARCTSVNANYWRFELTATGTAAVYTYQLYPAGTTNATQSTGTIDATATGSAVFYGAQVELGSFATPYQPTTTAAVARNADVLTYPSTGNIDGTKGWAYAEVQRSVLGTGSNSKIVDTQGTTGTAAILVEATTGQPRIYDGTTFATSGLSGITINTTNKVASTWGGITMQVALAGTAGNSQVFDGNLSPTVLVIGGDTIAGDELKGTIRNVRIGQRQLSSSELQAMTA